MKHFFIAILLGMSLSTMAQTQSELTPQQRLEKAKREAAEAKQAIKEAKQAAKLQEQQEKNAAKIEAQQARQAAKAQAEQAKLEAKIAKAEAEAARLQAEAEAARKQLEQQRPAQETPQPVGLKERPEVKPAPQPVVKMEQPVVKEEKPVVKPTPQPVVKEEKPVVKEEPVQSVNGWTAPERPAPQPSIKQEKTASLAVQANGEVPEINGKVVFTLDLTLPGKTADEIYAATYHFLEKQATDAYQRKGEVSGIQLVNKEEHQIVARYQEWITFYSSSFSLDRTKFNYLILVNCDNERLHLTMERINYSYEENRETGFHKTAEELISDKAALNKKGEVIRPARKFRNGTIQRKDQIFNALSEILER